MTLDNTILNLKRELIRSFAVLDAWFDKDEKLHKHTPPPEHLPVYEAIDRIVQTNNYMMSLIDNGCGEAMKNARLNTLKANLNDYELNDLLFDDPEVRHFFQAIQKDNKMSTNPLHVLRAELRDQLDRCLCHLELMKNGEGALFSAKLLSSHSKKMDMYQWMQLMAVHIWQQIDRLKQTEQLYIKEHVKD